MQQDYSALYAYLQDSELRIVNDSFRVRFSKELAAGYDKGEYATAINRHAQYIAKINALKIQYPGGLNPIFYMYIVPDKDIKPLLLYPEYIDATRGGRPVQSFDIDGFSQAYGCSQNCLVNQDDEENILSEINGIHEFAHLVHGQFFNCYSLLSEGFAEVLPLYTLYCEEKCKDDKNMKLHHDKIRIMQEKGTFILPVELCVRQAHWDKNDRYCSLMPDYISAYLFVRGYIEKLWEFEKKSDVSDRKAATQLFLDRVHSVFSQADPFEELAKAVNIPFDKLFGTTDLQMAVGGKI